MFKNAMIYKVSALAFTTLFADCEDAMSTHAFIPCGATQAKSSGWVPPRGEAHGLLMETIGGQHILKLMTETKLVPADVVKRRVDEDCAHIEQTTGRKPGKKERRALKEDAMMTLLPIAFRKQSATLIWIDPAANLIVIDASNPKKADEVVTMLVKTFDGLALQFVWTKTSPASAMAHMLVEPIDNEGFTIDRECELKATDESKAVVKYGRHPLDIEEVGQHIRMGKMPTKLALTWSDRVSFVLTEAMTLKKISFLDSVFEVQPDEKADQFDADVAITTGELSKLIPDLIAMLGGEMEAV